MPDDNSQGVDLEAFDNMLDGKEPENAEEKEVADQPDDKSKEPDKGDNDGGDPSDKDSPDGEDPKSDDKPSNDASDDNDGSSKFVSLDDDNADQGDDTPEGDKTDATDFVRHATNGEFDSVESLHSSHEELKSELESLRENQGDSYKTDVARKLDDFVAKGGKPEQFFKYQTIDVDKLNPVEKLKTVLQWKDGSITESQVESYLKSKHDLDDLNWNEIPEEKQVELRLAASEAEEQLKSIQAEMTPEEQPSNEVDELAVIENQDKVFDSYTGVIDKSIEDMSKNGFQIRLSDKQGYKVDVDRAGLVEAANQAEEAFLQSGVEFDGKSEEVQGLIRKLYVADNIDRIVADAIKDARSEEADKYFTETHNPSPGTKGDKPTGKTQKKEGESSREELAEELLQPGSGLAHGDWG